MDFTSANAQLEKLENAFSLVLSLGIFRYEETYLRLLYIIIALQYHYRCFKTNKNIYLKAVSVRRTLLVMSYFDGLAACAFRIVNLFGYFLMFLVLV